MNGCLKAPGAGSADEHFPCLRTRPFELVLLEGGVEAPILQGIDEDIAHLVAQGIAGLLFSLVHDLGNRALESACAGCLKENFAGLFDHGLYMRRFLLLPFSDLSLGSQFVRCLEVKLLQRKNSDIPAQSLPFFGLLDWFWGLWGRQQCHAGGWW